MAKYQQFWTARFSAAPDHAEKLSAAFQDDAVALTVLAPPRRKTAVVEALYKTEPDEARLNAQLSLAAMLHGLPLPKLSIAVVPPLDWLEKVASDFPALPIARWTIHGAMHRSAVPDRRYALQIDATSAFGTGEHPTTRGCLIMLHQLLKHTAPQSMLDVGCGSAILAMGFLKSRTGKAVAVDLDAESIRVAKENANVNGLAPRMTILLGSGYRNRQVRAKAPYDLIMANIFAGPLSQMAKDLKRHLRPGGHAILSGILNHQANRVITAHRQQGLIVTRKMIIGEWSILALHRPLRAQ